MTKTEIVKIILFLACAFACAMGVMHYIASTASAWRALLWICVFAVGFTIFVFFFCRALALFMVRFDNRSKDDIRITTLTRQRREEAGDL